MRPRQGQDRCSECLNSCETSLSGLDEVEAAERNLIDSEYVEKEMRELVDDLLFIRRAEPLRSHIDYDC